MASAVMRSGNAQTAAILLGLPGNNGLDNNAQRIYTTIPMARKRYSFWIDHEQATGLKVVKDRDGAPESEQIRRAINEWLEKKGVRKKAERPRAAIRKRS